MGLTSIVRHPIKLVAQNLSSSPFKKNYFGRKGGDCNGKSNWQWVDKRLDICIALAVLSSVCGSCSLLLSTSLPISYLLLAFSEVASWLSRLAILTWNSDFFLDFLKMQDKICWALSNASAPQHKKIRSKFLFVCLLPLSMSYHLSFVTTLHPSALPCIAQHVLC